MKNWAGDGLRSLYPLACLLDICGNRWPLQVIRELMFSRSRLKDFAASPEARPGCWKRCYPAMGKCCPQPQAAAVRKEERWGQDVSETAWNRMFQPHCDAPGFGAAICYPPSPILFLPLLA